VETERFTVTFFAAAPRSIVATFSALFRRQAR
jgi:hypothetical protein